MDMLPGVVGVESVAASAFVAAAALGGVLTPIMILVARRRRLVAKPRPERWHRTPTALYGGVPIFVAAGVVALAFTRDPRLVALEVGATLMFAVGLADDASQLKPRVKLAAQLLASAAFLALYLRQFPYAGRLPVVLYCALALLWLLAITNAFNLLDNMDGLSAGVASLVGLLMAARSALIGDYAVMLASLVVSGAALGFLLYNFNPAKIFMGDCGSLFLGFALAGLSLIGQGRHLVAGNLFTAVLSPSLVLATPLFDTAFVSVVRVLHGRSIAQGGRDHTSHRLVLLGLSERRAVSYLYGITLWFGLVGLWGTVTTDHIATVVVTLLSLVALAVFAFFLAEVQAYSQQEYDRLWGVGQRGWTAIDAEPGIIRSLLVLLQAVRYKRRIAKLALDLVLTCACWPAALLLRFGGQGDNLGDELVRTLPLVVLCQTAAFFAFRVYRGLWHFVSVRDMWATIRAVLVGGAAVYLATRLVTHSVPPLGAVVIIYVLLLSPATIGIRLTLRLLRYHFALRAVDGFRRVLVVGAGHTGETAVREMLANRALGLRPVAFVDDDPYKVAANVYGVPVVGSSNDLPRVIDRLGIEEIVIAMPPANADITAAVARHCEPRGIGYQHAQNVLRGRGTNGHDRAGGSRPPALAPLAARVAPRSSAIRDLR